MAENGSGNTATVAIVVLVIVALAFIYLVFIRGGDSKLEIDVDTTGSMVVPHVEYPGSAEWLPRVA